MVKKQVDLAPVTRLVTIKSFNFYCRFAAQAQLAALPDLLLQTMADYNQPLIGATFDQNQSVRGGADNNQFQRGASQSVDSIS